MDQPSHVHLRGCLRLSNCCIVWLRESISCPATLSPLEPQYKSVCRETRLQHHPPAQSHACLLQYTCNHMLWDVLYLYKCLSHVSALMGRTPVALDLALTSCHACTQQLFNLLTPRADIFIPSAHALAASPQIAQRLCQST